MAASKTGHARQRHGLRSPAAKVGKSASNLAVASGAHKGVNGAKRREKCGAIGDTAAPFNVPAAPAARPECGAWWYGVAGPTRREPERREQPAATAPRHRR